MSDTTDDMETWAAIYESHIENLLPFNEFIEFDDFLNVLGFNTGIK